MADVEHSRNYWWLNLGILALTGFFAFLLYTQLANPNVGNQGLFNIGIVYLFLIGAGLIFYTAGHYKVGFFRSYGIESKSEYVAKFQKALPVFKDTLLYATYVFYGAIIGAISTLSGRAFLSNLIIAPQLPASIDTATNSYTKYGVSPISEEIFWRGILMPSLENFLAMQYLLGKNPFAIIVWNGISFLIALFTQAATWAGWHWAARIDHPEELPALFAFGTLLGVIDRIVGNVLPSISAHLTTNAING